MSESRLTIALYRGHTHGEFAFLETSSIAKVIGNWCRDKLADKEFVPKGWSWDPIRKIRVFNAFSRWKIKKLFCTYNRKLQHLSIPIAFCDEVKREMEIWGAEVKELRINDYPLRKLDEHIKMRSNFPPRDYQIPFIEACSQLGAWRKGVSLQAGKGKSFIGVNSIVNLGNSAIIIVPGLVDQWIDDILEYTTARKGVDVHKLEGFDTFAYLAKNPGYKPTIFVASTRTMQMFCNGDEGYELLPWDYAGFFKAYGIGTKIIDECHKQFHANTMMDLAVNTPNNIYLSATFDQSSRAAREIFNKIFPEDMQVGGQEYDKYVTVHFVNFFGEVQEKRCRKSKGYMHMLYEQELMKSDCKLNAHMNNVILPLINQHYINRFKPGHKCLVFCSTIEFVDALVKKLKAAYPDKRVISYTASSVKSELAKTDIAVSTVGKAGTGLDWKGLHCCLNTVSVRSPVLTKQMLGRLRKINDAELIYVDICDNNLESQCRHAEDRKRDLKKMAIQFFEYRGFDEITNGPTVSVPTVQQPITSLWA